MRRTTFVFVIASASLGLFGCKRSPPQVTLDNTSASATVMSGAAGADVSGSYTITSSHNPGSTTGYKGSLSIDKHGEVFRLHWNIAGATAYSGVAIETGSSLAVGWGRGKAYGVVVYTIEGGTLHGAWANHDSDKLGIEELSGPSGLNGDYTITKASLPGGNGGYTGHVHITPSGSTYAVAWKLSNGDSYSGVGIKDGDKLIVGWGTAGSEAGAVDYKITGSGLEGTWATPGGTQLGGETLAKK